MRYVPCLLAALFLTLSFGFAQAQDEVSFRKDVAPIFLSNCIACHGAKKAEGSYRLDAFERVAQAGDTGAAPVTAGKLEESELYRRITSTDEGERMPLMGDPLPEEQVALVRRWIEQGAKYDAEDPKADLATIVPPPVHPDPPEAYPQTLPITALEFSADGSQVFAGGYHELTVWSAADGQLLRRIKNVDQRTYGLDLNLEGKLLAVACGSPGQRGEVRLFNAESGELVKVLGTTSDVAFDAVFSPDGKRLATCAADGVVRVYDVESGKEELTITSHSDWVMAVAWNADGSKLATASRDKTAKVFDAKTGELAITFSEHNQPVKGVAFHPGGTEVYSSGADNKVVQWKIEDGKKSGDVVGFGGEAYKLTTGEDFLFAVSADKSARQFQIADRKHVRDYRGHAEWVLCCAYHAPTKRLATGAFDGEVRIWNAEDGAQVTQLIAAPGFTPPAK
jgi:WD40 repeat protein/mono/diheme cytochrome c family protein